LPFFEITTLLFSGYTDEITHVYDITHAIAICMKRLYEDDENFIDDAHSAGQMRF